MCGELVVRRVLAVQLEAREGDGFADTDALILVGSRADLNSQLVAVANFGRSAYVRDLGSGRAVVDLGGFNGHTDDGNFLHGNVGVDIGGLCGELVVRRVLAVQLEAGEGDGFADTDVLILVGGSADLNGQLVAVADFGRFTRVRDLGSGRAVVDLGGFDGRADDGDFLHGDVGGDVLGLRGELVVCRVLAVQRKAGEGDDLTRADVLIGVSSGADLDGQLVTVADFGRSARACDLGFGRAVVDLGGFDGRTDDGDLGGGDLKEHFRNARLNRFGFSGGQTNGVGSDVLRCGFCVCRVVGIARLELPNPTAVGPHIAVNLTAVDRLAVISAFGHRVEVEDRRILFHRQLYSSHGRLVARFVGFSHRTIRRAEGVFARRERAEIAVFQRDRSVVENHVLAFVDPCLVEVERRDRVAVQLHFKAHVVLFKHREADRLGDRLGIGVEYDALGVDDRDIAAPVGHTDVDEELLLRLDGEACLAVLHAEQRPVAGNGVDAFKHALGEEIFDLRDAAARIRCGHIDGHRVLEEQTESDSVQEGLEAALADDDFSLGRGDVRNALHGDGQIAAHVVNKAGVAALVAHAAVRLRAVYQHRVVGSLGVAVLDRYGELVVGAVPCGFGARKLIARAADQRDAVELHDAEGDGYGVARNVRSGEGVLLVVRLHAIGEIGVGGLFHGRAVELHGEAVGIGNGEFHRAVVGRAVGNTADDGSLGVGLLHIAAAAELFVAAGVPYAGVGVRDDLDIRGDADAPVNDIVEAEVQEGISFGEAVDELFPVDGQLSERTCGKGSEVNVRFDERVRYRRAVALNGQRAAALGGQFGKGTVLKRHRAAGFQLDGAVKLRGAADNRRTARLYEHRVAADAGNGQIAAVIYVDRAGNADYTGTAVVGHGRRAAHVQVLFQRAGRQGQHASAAAADVICKGRKGKVARADAVDCTSEAGVILRRQLAALAASDFASDDCLCYRHRTVLGTVEIACEEGVVYRQRTAGTKDGVCKRAVECGAIALGYIAYNGKLRALVDLNAALHFAVSCGVQHEGTGVYDEAIGGGAQEGQGAACVRVGLRCGEGVRFVNVADDVGGIFFAVGVSDDCGNVAVAFRTSKLVFVAEPAPEGDFVGALSKIDDEGIGVKLIAAVLHHNAVCSVILGSEVLGAERQIHRFGGRNGLLRLLLFGADLYQRCGDLFGFRAVKRAGDRHFCVSTIFCGGGDEARDVLGLRGNVQRRGNNADIIDPIDGAVAGGVTHLHGVLVDIGAV